MYERIWHIYDSLGECGTYTTVQANMAHMRQSRPDFGFDFQVKVLTTVQVVPSLLGSGLVLSE